MTSSPDPNTLIELVYQAVAAGIPIVNINTPDPDANWSAYVGGNLVDYGEAWAQYLVDNELVAVEDVIDTLFLAADVYQDERYRKAALRTADFLLFAQMPDPQPGWAQQYNYAMKPIWARKFEPPAISGRRTDTHNKFWYRYGDPRFHFFSSDFRSASQKASTSTLAHFSSL